ncbi:hypothetical protein CI102_1725 [Trichoderma harzianum]|uniref:Transcription factor domain-containing protein n=1 Tax=Trichoderma harzianum CBS 226.95 TaxID=983964 RepID=A0A2T3ZW06_TRIHA|nr:hypothetical protein M431DRAFT_513293 [Trichoderma harzianum CBS 226.95]PKK54283.1 hypothetical protein CI102_1725 [Trichoderma harzianum]PTB48992.1 hypothetical protein M431DRAFT_513293 [Trichoderma harzianum CBS 226.95]
MTDPAIDGFQFILHAPNERLSKENRSKIRRHAMKVVGAARRTPNDASHRESAKYYKTHRGMEMSSLLPPMPLSGLELLVKDQGLDPFDLSSLTTVHIGPIASSLLQLDSSQLPGVLAYRQWSYFSLIPPRFGHVAALDDAFQCLVTITHSLLVPNHRQSDRVILQQYGKALQSLQKAVDEPNSRYYSEILCATGMLSIFELLNSPNGQLWYHHIAGASQIIQYRGPERFSSDFDIALLLSLGYPICAESLLNNKSCFLDDPTWIQVIKNAIDDREIFTDRSPLGIRLLTLMVRVPGLAKKTCHAVTMQHSLQPRDFDAVAAKVRILRSDVAAWRRDFNMTLIHTPDTTKKNSTLDTDKRYELLGVALIIQILVSRMIVCISPNDRGLLEEEVQSFAIELKCLLGSVRHHRRAEFFLTQKVKIANAALVTHDDFAAAIGCDRVIEAWKLKKFDNAFGRKTCDGITCCVLEER